MVTSDNDPRRATAGETPLVPRSVRLSAAAAAPRSRASPRFGSRFSPSPRTLSTQLSTFSGNVREGEAGNGGRQAASEKCPRSVTTLRLLSFFFLSSFLRLLLPHLVLHPRARERERGWIRNEWATRVPRAFSFFPSSFLPSFLPPCPSVVRYPPRCRRSRGRYHRPS